MSYSDKLKDPRWQKKRLEILSRDEFRCTVCGDTKTTLHIHHISYHGNPWDAPNNRLVTLCSSCHLQEEIDLKNASSELLKSLKQSGFGSNAISSISKLFSETDRNWHSYEPAFDIIKMVIDDDSLWNEIEEIFWERLNQRSIARGDKNIF